MSSHIALSRSSAASARNTPTSSASHGSTSGAVYSGSSTPIAGLNGIIRWRTASFSAVFSMSWMSFSVAGPTGRGRVAVVSSMRRSAWSTWWERSPPSGMSLSHGFRWVTKSP
ncbi:hypothetical protein [Parafrankia sp. FMc2]|uniref:hypothetical protein n=1 Tax=Parafrankia sp. FMc2 TaxID=3233196 RepID=UPI0034D7AA1D